MSLSKHSDKSQRANNKALPAPPFVDALHSRCCELSLRGQKCNSKPQIMGCEVKQQQPLVLCLSASLSQVCQKEENA